MKKFLGVFFGMFLGIIFGVILCMSVMTTDTVTYNNIINTNKAITQEFNQYEKNPSFRDLDFFIKLGDEYLEHGNTMLNGNYSNGYKRNLSFVLTSIMHLHYMQIRAYIQHYVIEKSDNKELMRMKCAKLLNLIEEGFITTKKAIGIH